MPLYHELSPEALRNALADGLKRTSRGDKGQDEAIKKTDTYLDRRRPDALRKHGVSRDDNIYAYLGTDRTMIDIRDGRTIPLAEHPDPDSRLVMLSVDPSDCFVSDLDRYDTLRQAITDKKPVDLKALAADYWQHVIPLPDYQPGSVRRPEIMVTRDLPPASLTPIDTA